MGEFALLLNQALDLVGRITVERSIRQFPVQFGLFDFQVGDSIPATRVLAGGQQEST